MNLSDRVRANVLHLLEAKGWTYSDLGWDRRYVSHVLRGDKGFTTDRIDEFAARLGVDVSILCARPPLEFFVEVEK